MFVPYGNVILHFLLPIVNRYVFMHPASGASNPNPDPNPIPNLDDAHLFS